MHFHLLQAHSDFLLSDLEDDGTGKERLLHSQYHCEKQSKSFDKSVSESVWCSTWIKFPTKMKQTPKQINEAVKHMKKIKITSSLTHKPTQKFNQYLPYKNVNIFIFLEYYWWKVLFSQGKLKKINSNGSTA